MSKRLVVIGGGAAGFFCAVNAARMQPSLKVILLEKSGKLLSKVKVSGGGRCNVTHRCFDISEMIHYYPRGQHFVRKAFYHFFTVDTIKWFEDRGVKIKAEKDGRMFPATHSSQTIIDCLLREVDKYKVEIKTNAEVKRLNIETDSLQSNVRASNLGREQQNANKFIIELSDSGILTAEFVCIACGGYPKLSMFEWIKQTGHHVEEPIPSLFTFNMPDHPITNLMGVSVEKVTVKIADTKLKEEGPLLITHWGLSGPVILKLSAWGAKELAKCNWQFVIYINWLPNYNEHTLREKLAQYRNEFASQKVYSKSIFDQPQRLWEYILKQSEIDEKTRWADLPAVKQNKLTNTLCNTVFSISGKTTFKEEFVTAGGVKLNEVDPNTMMSKKVGNLFFAGEILDVDGITGGFNFQHAWTSGFIAGKNIAANADNIDLACS